MQKPNVTRDHNNHNQIIFVGWQMTYSRTYQVGLEHFQEDVILVLHL